MNEHGYQIAGGLLELLAIILWITWVILVIVAAASTTATFTITTWWMILLVIAAIVVAIVAGILIAIGDIKSR